MPATKAQGTDVDWKIVHEGWLYQRRSGNILLLRRPTLAPRYLVLCSLPVPRLALFEQRSDARSPYGSPVAQMELSKEVELWRANGTPGFKRPLSKAGDKDTGRRSSIASLSSVAQLPGGGASTADSTLVIKYGKEKWTLECASPSDRDEWLTAIEQVIAAYEERLGKPPQPAPPRKEEGRVSLWGLEILGQADISLLLGKTDDGEREEEEEIRMAPIVGVNEFVKPTGWNEEHRQAVDQWRATGQAEWDLKRLLVMQRFNRAAAESTRQLVDGLAMTGKSRLCDPQRVYCSEDGQLRLCFCLCYDDDEVDDEQVERVHARIRRELHAMHRISTDRNAAGIHPMHLTAVIEYKGFWLMATGAPGGDEDDLRLVTDAKERAGVILKVAPRDAPQCSVYATKDGQRHLLANIGDLLTTASSATSEERLCALLADLESCLVLPLDSLEWTAELHRRGLPASSLGWLAAKTGLPHIRDAATIEMLARTVKCLLRPRLRQVVFAGKTASLGTGNELAAVVAAALNALLATNGWSPELVEMGESKFGGYRLRRECVAELPRSMLLAALAYHCAVSLGSTTAGAIYPEDIAFVTKPVVCREYTPPIWSAKGRDELEAKMDVARLLAETASLAREQRASLAVLLAQLKEHAAIGRSLCPVDHPARLLLAKDDSASQLLVPPEHPLTIMLRQQEADAIAARHASDPRLLPLLQNMLAVSIKALGRAHPWTRRLVIRIGHWHAGHKQLDDAIVFFQDAIKSASTSIKKGDTDEERLLLPSLWQSISECQEHKDELEAALCSIQQAIGLLEPMRSSDIVPALCTAARLCLLIYSVHCGDALVPCPSASAPLKVLLGPLPKPMPLLTAEASDVLVLARSYLERLFLRASASEKERLVLARQLAGLNLRLAQASQRIVIDSLPRPAKGSNAARLAPVTIAAEGGGQQQWLEGVRRTVDEGGAAELQALIALACMDTNDS